MGCISSKQPQEPLGRKPERKPSTASVLSSDLNSVTNQYAFKELIGQGRFGRVFLAESAEGKQVAIKIVSKGDSSKSPLMEEVRILSEVDHPNIIRYLEHYESERYLYVVMEYCAGGDLFQKLIDQGKFDEDKAAQAMEELLRAINYCHHLGIIHRDLKPENILYTSKGTLKLIDFGISVKSEAAANEKLAGTAQYIAPEIYVDEIYSTACDVWSLGVIMYVLLSGHLPIGGENINEIEERVMRYPGPSFKLKKWEQVSEEAKDLLKKMLDPDYKTRITAAEALKHPWFISKINKNFKCCSGVIEALRKYSEYPRVKKSALKLVVKHMNEEEVKEFRGAFLELDREMDGLLTCSDLEESLGALQNEMTGEQIEELIRRVNFNGEAFINYSSFLAALISTNKLVIEEKLKSLFSALAKEWQGDLKTLGPEKQRSRSDSSQKNLEDFKAILCE
eukprot:TRINITY_DN2344_c0_g2_i1.p1 TRINITY_DN2344_c0_g2~~TRINITY_DN2344_c0_g2_i1.p1  ORF type:complete len:451 (+),score=103.28 TRINITY_DN2344_c0_g2_i1:187-1539(+)